MAIDPSIYGQIQAPQQQNLLAQYGQIQAIQGAQNQNRLADLMYGEKQHELGADKEMARLIASGGDVAQGLASAGYGSRSQAFTKSMQDSQEQKGKILRQNIDAVDLKLKQSRALLDGVNTPEQYLRWHEANHSDPVLGPVLAARGVTVDQSLAAINNALATPGGFDQLLNQSRLGIEKFTEFNKPTIGSQNLGGSVQQTQTPGMGGAPVVTGSFNTTQSPESIASNAQSGKNNAATVGASYANAAATRAVAQSNTDAARIQQGFASEQGLRKEFETLPEVKNYKQAYPAFAAIKDAVSRNTTQSDINIVYGLAKLYDPNSVVREGEYATVANSPSIPEKVKGYAQYLAGGGRLSPDTKRQIMAEATGRIRTYESEANKAKGSYNRIAKESGMNPSAVFADMGDMSQSKSVDFGSLK